MATALVAPAAIAQNSSHDLVRPTSEASDRIRLGQLAGDTTTLDAYLVRSSSLLLPRAHGHSAWALHSFRPDAQLIVNSAIPFGPNTGAMWAERGVSWRVTPGIDVERGRFRAIVAPDLWFTSNARFDFQGAIGFFTNKPVPVKRYGDGFADVWYVAPYSADVPWRMGSSSVMRLWPGQSGAWYNSGPVEIGVTSENMWWGPGIQNAIVMSDNAAGVPRLELRTPHPIRTRVGNFEAQWFLGALSESQYFDTTKTDDVRSLTGAVVTWRPSFQPNLSLGVSRVVFATATSYPSLRLHWLDVLYNTGQPDNVPASDSSLTPGGRDQLLSLFGRWVLPSDGFEFYTEWARQELPYSLHDFIVAPTHSHGYTIGLQYRTPVPLTEPAFRLQLEATSLEPSSSSANRLLDVANTGSDDRPRGVFYTSRRVIQGYTQLGKPIGAAIGPGSSSQWLAVDRVWQTGSVGLTFNRIRWDEGVRASRVWAGYLGACNQDVSIIPGVRGGHSLAGGYLSADVRFAQRFNYHFQNLSGCFGPEKVDINNTTVSLSFSPFRR